MKHKFLYLTISLGLLLAACGSPEKMKDTAAQIKVTCEPSVLVATAGVVKAKITVSFPEKYFHTAAVLEMLPVVKYNGGELALTAKVLQGEGVKDNNQVIRNTGGSYTQEIEFAYDEKFAKSTLEIRPTLIMKEERLQYPADLKAADGVSANYTLAEVGAVPLVFEGTYQKSIEVSENAEIKFLISQANVRPTELKKDDLKGLAEFLSQTLNDESLRLKEFEISSYASPDGPLDKNEALSIGRGKSANAAVNDYLKKFAAAANAKSKSKAKPQNLKLDNNLLNLIHTAEDWDGFQKLMEASSIEDKALVLRVLSMYSDPQIRENEIKNIAAVYKEIADKILPELRRSKLTLKAERLNLTDEQLQAIVAANLLDTLDESQLIHATSLYSQERETQKTLYRFAIEKFGNYIASNNLGTILLSENNIEEAKPAFEAALAKLTEIEAAKPDIALVKNNLGYVALLQGDREEAEKFLASAGLDASKTGLGYLAIQKGKYSDAETFLNASASLNEGLALLLVGKLDRANAALAEQTTPKAYYVKAIIAARKNVAEDVKKNLDLAGDEWKEKAKNSVEFANFQPQLQ